MNKYITRPNITKFFLIGMVLQFFLHTFFTYGLGIDGPIMSIVWLWKEILVLGALLYLGYHSIKIKSINRLWENKRIAFLQVVFVLAVLIAFIISIGWHGQGLVEFAMAFKYDFFGFLIFFTFYHLASLIQKEQRTEILYWFLRVIKVLLVIGVLWRGLIEARPQFFERFGYTLMYNEADVGIAPPIRYFTAEHMGFIRLQYLFERPISYGFFLTAFWPLFYVHFLKRKSIKNTRIRWVLYIFNVVVTFARSARGSIFIQIFLLGLLAYKKHLKKFLIGIILPLFIGFSGLVYRGKSELIFRYASNSGHMQFVQQAITMIGEKPILGRGAATAGPGSHHKGDVKSEFNPENQFLQIIVEFGIFGFIRWMVIYSYFIFIGYKPAKAILMDPKANTKKVKDKYKLDRLIIALAIGMIGLSISGLVLHSFSDRMIVYPFMAIFGILMYEYYHRDEITESKK